MAKFNRFHHVNSFPIALHCLICQIDQFEASTLDFRLIASHQRTLVPLVFVATTNRIQNAQRNSRTHAHLTSFLLHLFRVSYEKTRVRLCVRVKKCHRCYAIRSLLAANSFSFKMDK